MREIRKVVLESESLENCFRSTCYKTLGGGEKLSGVSWKPRKFTLTQPH